MSSHPVPDDEPQLDAATRQSFDLRWERYLPDLEVGIRKVYRDRADETIARVRSIILARLAERSAELRRLDEARLLEPDWLQKPQQIGYVAYADRFAGTLSGVGEHLDHLADLGVSYLHLMPLLQPRPGESDGGYAVADYRRVRPDLGTMDDLAELTGKLRRRHISLVMDLVLNHVAAEHEWARRACAGDPRYREYFHILDDRDQVDAWERSLPEVFPDFAPGNFTWNDELDGWVWTTFNSFQWDLNWANPDVFCEFVDLIAYLANQGVEVFRLDAIAFIWKQMGTDCQNEPPVHDITQSLRQALRILAPAVAFKAEAIVGPGDLISYLGRGRHAGKVSDMAYHNALMVHLWSTLASRDCTLMETALRKFPDKPTSTTWGTYVRCHDDIGWAIDDPDAWDAGMDPYAHRRFLSDFYSGQFPGSFARGLVFQANPATGDRRISGSLASLAGLELALEKGDRARIDDAIARIVMLHTAILGYGGVPLLWMGDEVGMLNDDGYVDDPDHAADNRWVHRPVMDWDRVAQARSDPSSVPGRIWAGIRRAIEVRRTCPELHASVETVVLPSPDKRVMMWGRPHPEGSLIELYNVTEDAVWFPLGAVRESLGDSAVELLSGFDYDLTPAMIRLEPYDCLWLSSRD
ncbi:alpha-amylase family protein [Acidipropionibacterium timonense]|uniref:alpha-amylase family protein n=1 Tax=Acidipropionibacterium timonense TaxID=2161818 RepID=UPI00102FF22F|nr:alpha-amylase family protein [Acidipropionibacterium timonense]